MGDRSKTRSQGKDESRKRGLVAGGAAVATGVATATVGVVPLTVAGLAGTGYLTYRWWKHRAKNGLKF